MGRWAIGFAVGMLLGIGPEAAGERLPRLGPVLGQAESALVDPEETLLDVAYEHRLGFEAVIRLNPDVDPWIPQPGTVVRLPTRFLLPQVDPQGLVINIPEMRLYDFTVSGGPEVLSVAIGDQADPSILGEFKVGGMRENPTWNVPASIRAEDPSLPERVPPGPDNPLGSRWITIGQTSYGIHGTNVRWSIGREATHGCLRLYEDDIKRLYDRVKPGIRIQIVYQPYKWGRDERRIYFEAHPDPYRMLDDPLEAALAVPRALGLLGSIDAVRVWRALQEARGVPIEVGTPPASTSTPTS